MSSLAPMGYAPMAVLLAIGFVVGCFQALRICHVASARRESPLALAAEVGVLVHLILLCMVFRCIEQGTVVLDVLAGFSLLAPDLLWANLSVAVLAGCTACCERRAAWLIALFPLMATCPAALSVCGQAWPVICAADLMFFAGRIAWPYLNGRRWGGQGVGAASPSEVLNLLPHGVLCANEWGTVVLLNTAMRDVLVALGLKTDLADARTMFRTLALQSSSAEQLVQMDDGRSFAIVIDDSYRESEGLRFAIAYDVSEETRVNSQLEEANNELAIQNARLSRMLQNILTAANREANLRMRGAVHDIVGQRLSILHRHLEDRELDDASIAALRSLLSDLLADLQPVSSANPEAEISALAEAFETTGVSVHVDGSLSSDSDAAQLQVRIVREALSNALRHGNAQNVRVVLGQRGGRATVRVENDGTAADAIIEGNGLAGLREAVEGRGGTFSVTGSPKFAVEAEF